MDQSKHSEGTTSVKVHHRPGGNTSIDLFGGYGGDDGTADRQRNRPGNASAAAAAINPSAEEEEKKKEEEEAAKNAGAATEAAFDVYGNKVSGTSVRVHNPPGGKSSITF